MPRNFNVDQLIQGAKLAAAAGEMVPFPYLKGAAQCAVIFLEAIEVRAVGRCCTSHR